MEPKYTNGINILDIPLQELNLTIYFQNKSAEMGFSTIRQITDCGWGALESRKDFCYTWFNELVKFLKGIDQLSLLDTKT